MKAKKPAKKPPETVEIHIHIHHEEKPVERKDQLVYMVPPMLPRRFNPWKPWHFNQGPTCLS